MAVGDGRSPLHTYDTRRPQRKNAYGSPRSATSPPGFPLFPLFPFSFALPFLCVVVRSGGWGREHLWSVDWGRCSSGRRFDRPSSPSRESEARGIGFVTTSAICELKKTSAKRQYWDKKGTRNLAKKPKENYCACGNVHKSCGNLEARKLFSIVQSARVSNSDCFSKLAKKLQDLLLQVELDLHFFCFCTVLTSLEKWPQWEDGDQCKETIKTRIARNRKTQRTKQVRHRRRRRNEFHWALLLSRVQLSFLIVCRKVLGVD
jgi:hypothetical protein